MKRLVAMVVAVIVVIVSYRLIQQRVELAQTHRTVHADIVADPALDVDTTFEVFADSVRKGADLPTCQGMLQQVNAYLNSHGADHPPPLAPEQRTFLKTQYALGDAELAEVDNGSFTSLDGHYLELALLLREVIGSMRLAELPPLAGATRCFSWVVRQVGLQAPLGDACPPQFVVRRGYGSALERAFVFMALLDQLGIDNCMLVVPEPGPVQESTRYWIPAVLLNQELYLFDTRLGFPIPGPKGKEIATLKQVRDHPELLKALTVDEKYPYDVKPADARRARVEVACPLNAMSPRMRYLQGRLANIEKVSLFVDPQARFERFQTALKDSNSAATLIKGWNHPGDKNNPIQVLRSFLPPQEGGTDANRRNEAMSRLVPWQYLPPILTQVRGELELRLREEFENPFKYFHTEPRMPREQLEAWLPGLVEAAAHKDTPGRISELILRERLPRDLVLRGKLEEASNLLVAIRDELHRQRGQSLDPKAIQEWFGAALQVDAALVQSQKGKPGGDPGALANAKAARDQLWDPKHREPVDRLVQVAAADPMLGEVGYLLALCKQEQAERVQANLERGRPPAPSPGKGPFKSPADSRSIQAWKSAASWWETYLDQPGISPIRASAARFQQARARSMLNQSEAAADLLRILPDNMLGLDKTGRLYLAKHGCQR